MIGRNVQVEGQRSSFVARRHQGRDGWELFESRCETSVRFNRTWSDTHLLRLDLWFQSVSDCLFVAFVLCTVALSFALVQSTMAGSRCGMLRTLEGESESSPLFPSICMHPKERLKSELSKRDLGTFAKSIFQIGSAKRHFGL